MYHIGMTQWIVGNEPLEQSCARLHKYGYNGIEFAAEPDKLDPKQCVELMKRYQLDCRSLCGIFSQDRDLTGDGQAGQQAVEYLRRSVDLAKQVGAGIIIVVPSPVGCSVKPAGKSVEELTDNAVRNLRLAADYAWDNGIKLAIEAINRYETWFANTLGKALALVQQVDHPGVGLMADLFHMSIEENSSVDSLYRIRDHLLHVHIADNTREPAGMGQIDFREILRTLHRIGYQGSLTMEFMYRLSDPYSVQGMSSQGELMDRYAQQAIDYIRMIEHSLDNVEEGA